jgi:DNA-binding GntR family transcriptional regulator
MASAGPLAVSLREQVVELLRKDILCGRLHEGESLSEISLAERFPVSRTPIREAMMQLTQEGLLESKTNLGVKVAPRPPDAIRELVVPIRRRLESFALRSYFHTLTAEDFDRFDDILNRLRAACIAHDYPSIAEHDIEFHRLIVRRAGQRDLDSIWASLLARVRSHFWETQRRNYDDPNEIYEEHVAILDEIRSGDLERAVNLLESHIE